MVAYPLVVDLLQVLLHFLKLVVPLLLEIMLQFLGRLLFRC